MDGADPKPPRMTTAFIFPGQGSQSVGMGRALAEASPHARTVFEEVDEALGAHLSRTMFDGPEDELTLTANAQPAIVAVSIAVLRVIEREGGVRLSERAAFVAGHSLGECTALCAAGALTLADAARLVRRRGQAMQVAVPPGVGAMAALLGIDLEPARAVAAQAAEGEVCVVANDNAPGQVVLSGHAAAIERAIVLARAQGAKKAIRLAVSAPFHCALMEPAARAVEAALTETPPVAPFVTLVANTTAAPVASPAEIARLLVEQVTGMVRWRESVAAMVDAGVTQFVELGAKVLGPMGKRTVPDAGQASLMTMADIEAWLR